MEKQPPVDNDHVAPGCEKFSPETIAANAGLVGYRYLYPSASGGVWRFTNGETINGHAPIRGEPVYSHAAPSSTVPDVVREWQTHDRGSWTYERLHEFTERMAAALVEEEKAGFAMSAEIEVLRNEADAQAKTIEGLREEYALCRTLLMERTAEVERLTGERDTVAAQTQALYTQINSLESSLETARGALAQAGTELEEAAKMLRPNLPAVASIYDAAAKSARALAALPSPPITKTEG